MSQTGKTPMIPLRSFVICALLLSLILLMSFTPIGFIAIGPIAITLVHIPVLVGLLCEGLGVGLFLGAAFGIISLLRALTPTTILSPFFLNPLVSILPRLLIPILAWLAYKGAKALLSRWPKIQIPGALAAAALVGTLTNTALVLGMIYLTSAAGVAQAMALSRNAVGGVLLGIALSNGIPEIILSVAVVPALVMAIQRATRQAPL